MRYQSGLYRVTTTSLISPDHTMYTVVVSLQYNNPVGLTCRHKEVNLLSKVK